VLAVSATLDLMSTLAIKLKPTILTAILLSSAVCGLCQQAETKVNARHVIGLENVKRNRAGKLTVQNGVMQFEAGTTDAKVPTAAINDLSIGSETTQAGGKVGTVAKTVALAAPYDSGAALSLLLRTKVDILTVSYRDSGRRAARCHPGIAAKPSGARAGSAHRGGRPCQRPSRTGAEGEEGRGSNGPES